MATRKKTRAKEAQLAFEALSIEGGLLSPDWLSRAAQLAAGGQSEADYRVPKGLNLRDEIGRFWRIAQAHWGDFEAGRAGKADAKPLAERFVEALLKESFGFATLVNAEPVILAERSYPIGFAALSGRVPIVVAPAGSGLDSLSPAFGDGVRRRTAFGLAQEYLNAADGAMWGLASDGLTLRIVRDNASLTRPAWIEVDLQRIFTEERYADFAALWLLAHESRFGRVDQPVAECALEGWRSAGREEGTRAREHLRRGVEDALIALGQGFLAHPDNQAVRAALQSGGLSTKDYFNQLLRLIYRLIFLLTVEEREVLHPDGADEKSKSLYAAGYSLRRLRERSVKRSAHDRFADLWEVTKIVFRGVDGGEQRLGLPALAGIFAKAQCPALDVAKLENRALLLAVFKLSWLRTDSGLARVNWRDMGPEELGSVYESLLELVPQISGGGRQFAFATGEETKGNARKTSGSYYTPDSLVQVLLDSALEPVVKATIARHPENPVEALLGLAIVDPSCGSGHFLLAAARRLASHVARFSANGTPSATEYRHALRQVVGRCIYGVDLNAMAVELCKVSLWMEAVEPGLPLTFLNSHIQHGNALLGATPELIAQGIPDSAWEPIEGDEKKTASVLKKRNKKASEGQRSLDTLWSKPRDAEAQALARAAAELEATSDATPEALARKESKWEGILDSAEYRHQKLVADAWCAAFVWPKQPGDIADVAPTNELWRQLRDRQGQPPALTVSTITKLAEQYRFFHWNLQFPQVFAKGGFSVVLGNPPWDRVKLQEREWFAQRDPEIANAANAASRQELVRALKSTNPALNRLFLEHAREAEGESHILRNAGLYPLCGRGDVNSYAVFAEANLRLLSAGGLVGCVLPPGIGTDDSTKLFIQHIVENDFLRCFFAFTNRGYIFRGIESTLSFALVVYGRAQATTLRLAAQIWQVEDLADQGRVYTIDRRTIEQINPNTRNLPILQSSRDAVLVSEIHRRVPVLLLEAQGQRVEENHWGVSFGTPFHMTNDAHLFVPREQLQSEDCFLVGNVFVKGEQRYLPLYEAKITSQFNHRHGTFDGVPPVERFGTRAQTNKATSAQLRNPDWEVLPRYWVAAEATENALPDSWPRGWLLGFRNAISAVADSRSVAFSIVPRVAVGNSLPLLFSSSSPGEIALLMANLNSFVLDYVARQKASGGNLNFYVVKQLPVFPRAAYMEVCPWDSAVLLNEWLFPRVLELAYTAWSVSGFAEDGGWLGAPFRWDEDRRFQLRSEIDAAYFHLYGLARDDVEYIMGTFPVFARHEEKAHGEYRSKRVILETYDALAAAARTRTPYLTRLDPPPAAPLVAHPDTRPSAEKVHGH